jgi:hypothetical protein
MNDVYAKLSYRQLALWGVLLVGLMVLIFF